MNYEDAGIDKSLKRPVQTRIRAYTPNEIDRLFNDIPGDKIFGYTSTKFVFIPTTPNANPTEGEFYYDKESKKLRIWNGTAYETITSQVI